LSNNCPRKLTSEGGCATTGCMHNHVKKSRRIEDDIFITKKFRIKLAHIRQSMTDCLKVIFDYALRDFYER
jgi:hypothetical protein